MENVYQKIALVQAALCAEGIAKDRRNTQQGYNFRGIDDVYSALSPILAKNKLCILPEFDIIKDEWRDTKNGGALHYVGVKGTFTLVSADDGSSHVISTIGEAMDSGDKATNKAMSAAYKYAAFQAFAIPTEGDNDADATTHVVTPPKKEAPKPAPKTSHTGEESRAFVESLEGFYKDWPSNYAKQKKIDDTLLALPVLTFQAHQSGEVKTLADLIEFAGLSPEDK